MLNTIKDMLNKCYGVMLEPNYYFMVESYYLRQGIIYKTNKESVIYADTDALLKEEEKGD